MNLELKHLSPYLPYGLKMIFEGKGGRIVEVTGLRVAGISEKTSNLLYFNSISETLAVGYFKPILRPISDLIQRLDFFEIGNENGYMVEFDHENFKIIQDLKNIAEFRDYFSFQFLPNIVASQLIEWNFDVFGLIEKGLAVSIHDVE